jgi:chromosome partitioning protein
MAIISFLNIKGGVGKTSMTFHLAGALAELGRKVLVVDNDPQANLSSGFWGMDTVIGMNPSETIVSIFRGEDPFPEQVIRPSGVAGIDVIGGSMQLDDYCHAKPEDASYEDHHCLKEFLNPISGDYQYILIDCAPYLRLGACAALTSSDFLVVPIKPDVFGVSGTIHVQTAMKLIEHGHNPDLKLLGYLPNLVGPRKAIHAKWINELRGIFGESVFKTIIPDLTDYSDSIQFQKSIVKYKPKGNAAKAMRAFTAEFESRLAIATTTAQSTEAA